ncbi:MAG: transketolase C-terminal domain-containing protein, partial [Patescibacteria group bacterium]
AAAREMAADPRVYIMGLGVPDPKGVFGTTLGLQAKYGDQRVMDMPTSENAMTGVAIGSAIVGMRPIMTHQRVDFALLSLDQIINNAAKWHYMFGGLAKVPLVIRMIIGRGWGQGPQHSQSLHALFAHIPGLKVVMPATPYDAKGLLISAIEDDNPVIYLEHRWLHGIFGPVPEYLYRVPIGHARTAQEGTDLTIVAASHMVLEALHAADLLAKDDIRAEVIDVRSVKPLDVRHIFESVRKTKRLLVADADWRSMGFAGEVIAAVTEEMGSLLYNNPRRISWPEAPSPSSWALANHFYPRAIHIANMARSMMGRAQEPDAQEVNSKPLDVPDAAFTGPF